MTFSDETFHPLRRNIAKVALMQLFGELVESGLEYHIDHTATGMMIRVEAELWILTPQTAYKDQLSHALLMTTIKNIIEFIKSPHIIQEEINVCHS